MGSRGGRGLLHQRVVVRKTPETLSGRSGRKGLGLGGGKVGEKNRKFGENLESTEGLKRKSGGEGSNRTVAFPSVGGKG